MTPALLAPYGWPLAPDFRPATDAVQTIEPDFCAIMCGVAYLIARNGPIRLMRRISIQCSTVWSAKGTSPPADAGIGPDRIEPAVFGHRLGDERPHVFFRAGVGLHRLDRAAGVADQLCGLLHALAAVDGDQFCAFFCEQQRRGAADAAAGAGNDDG